MPCSFTSIIRPARANLTPSDCDFETGVQWLPQGLPSQKESGRARTHPRTRAQVHYLCLGTNVCVPLRVCLTFLRAPRDFAALELLTRLPRALLPLRLPPPRFLGANWPFEFLEYFRAMCFSKPRVTGPRTSYAARLRRLLALEYFQEPVSFSPGTSKRSSPSLARARIVSAVYHRGAPSYGP